MSKKIQKQIGDGKTVDIYYDDSPITYEEAMNRYSEIDYTSAYSISECIDYVDKLISDADDDSKNILKNIKYHLQAANGYFPSEPWVMVNSGGEFPFIGQHVVAYDCYGCAYNTVYDPSKSEDGDVWRINGNAILGWMPYPLY